MENGVESFHSRKNEASKKKPPPPTIPLIGGVDVLKETQSVRNDTTKRSNVHDTIISWRMTTLPESRDQHFDQRERQKKGNTIALHLLPER